MNHDFGFASDPGSVSNVNEDSIGIVELTTTYQSKSVKIRFFTLADGMGGHEAGEIASRLAVSSIAYWLTSAFFSPVISGLKEFSSPEDFKNLLEEGVFFTNEKFRKRIAEDRLDLGSTLLLLLQVEDTIFILNVGDCRAYLLDKNSELRLLTVDHSLAFRYYLDQQIDFNGIARNPDRNKLFCSLGDPHLIDKLEEFNQLYCKTNVRQMNQCSSQKILLCTDGIWVNLTEQVIRETLLNFQTPASACHTLVKLAKAADGHDNSSAIVIQVP
jgi:protein phosphatase